MKKAKNKKNVSDNAEQELRIDAVGIHFSYDLSDIKPCPFCGNKSPFSYYNPFTAYLGCDACGVNFGSAKVIYKRDELPDELKGLEYEADGLIVIEDGKELHYPEHNRVGINCVTAFDHKGILAKWNARS